jgi:formylglycine-generating enzyme required for sulfatase activity/SAM-dependent methyltransferase
LQSGGYVERKWWVSPQGDDEGWRWRCFRNATHPSFWVATSHPEQKRFWGGKPDYPYQKDDGHARAGNDNAFKLRVLFDIVDMPWDWPVEVNNLEAAAFLRWKAATETSSGFTYRIPTEAEYHALRGDPSPAAFSNAVAAGSVNLSKQQTKQLQLLDKDDGSLSTVDVGAGIALAGNHQHNARLQENGHAKYHAGHHDLHEHIKSEASSSQRNGFSLSQLKQLTKLTTLEKTAATKVDPTLSQEEYVKAVAAASTKKGRVPKSVSGTVSIPGSEASAEASEELDLFGKVLLPDGTTVDKTNYELEAKARDALILDGADAEAALDVIMQPAAPGNLNLRWHSSTPVNFYPPSATGFHDTHGNVWQWVEDHFAPLPGFEIHFLYDDFSAPCFDGWHTEILGGSWVSTGDEASSFSRFHFRRHFFQHLGFRYVALPSSAPKEPFPGAATVTNLWEGMSTVSNGLTNGYLPLAEKVPYSPSLLSIDSAASYGSNLASFVAKTFNSLYGANKTGKVLHLGCGHYDVGATSFELVRAGFASVTGVDDHEPSIRHARLLQHHAQFEYERVDEGILTSTTLGKIQAGGLAPADRAKVSFYLGELTAATTNSAAGSSSGLSAEVLAAAPYDVVVVDDLLVRSTQPLDLLAKVPSLLKKGGLCVFASSNNWDPAVTPRNSWLGGFKMNGEPLSTSYLLKYHLGRHGIVPASAPAATATVASVGSAASASAESIVRTPSAAEIPRLKRKNARSFELDVLEVTAFVKTA